MSNIYAKCISNRAPISNELIGLTIGKLYEVETIDMGQSYTHITLKRKEGVYNSIHFKFFEELDIYSDKRFNPYL